LGHNSTKVGRKKGGAMAIKGARKYTPEFKEQAAELGLRIGLSRAAHQLGVNVANVRRWAKESNKSQSKELKKTKSGLEDEVKQLRRENEELKKVNHILKRAAAFFSQDHLK
jgi:transposase